MIQAIDTGKNNIPFQNVWYLRLVFDSLVITKLQNVLKAIENVIPPKNKMILREDSTFKSFCF